MVLSKEIPESQPLVWEVIAYCEAKNIHNECCTLSTIESLKRQTPEKVKAYLAERKRNHGAVHCPDCGRSMSWDKKIARFWCDPCGGFLKTALDYKD